MDREEEDKGFEFVDKRKIKQEEAARYEQCTHETGHEALWQKHMHPPDDNIHEDIHADGGHHCGHEGHEGFCGHDGQAEIPEVTFMNFIANLGTDAMVSLGMLQDPQGQTYKDLAVAKYIIDVIAMLQEKTRGNLNDSENQQTSDMLYHLRMAYMNIANQP
ncbi:protein containing DUF1844 [Candidatus Magnetobacterium bavaricum]|uniref:Protein containing DUF1844 n=1 Tax=Candidatus Magnetobacterium bavaricum TaxID=29290 RepID=A0A0F3GWG9_9BACT|nr:protein containing DUF1844 [Candidatus Magnetobacterium bavaricum]